VGGTSYRFDVAAVARLDAYFAQIGACLWDGRKRESFAMYALGILGEGERKSAEPIAARACGDLGEVQRKPSRWKRPRASFSPRIA
jgi:hypothetical protein